MKLPWSVEFYQKYGRCLSPASFLRLRSAVIAERQGRLGFSDVIPLRTRGNVAADIRLRPVSADLCTFSEVFVEEVYASAFHSAGDVKTFIDLGANIGLASLYCLGRHPDARILAVEPDQGNFELLTFNLRPYAITGQVVLLHGAFWPIDGPVTFLPPAQAGHVNAGAVLSGTDSEGSARGHVVQGLSMATILARSGFSTVDLLKVDIEGGERHLFAGDGSWLSRVGCAAVEFHDNSRKESGFDEAMSGAGFSVIEANPHTVVALRRSAGKPA